MTFKRWFTLPNEEWIVGKIEAKVVSRRPLLAEAGAGGSGKQQIPVCWEESPPERRRPGQRGRGTRRGTASRMIPQCSQTWVLGMSGTETRPHGGQVGWLSHGNRELHLGHRTAMCTALAH